MILISNVKKRLYKLKLIYKRYASFIILKTLFHKMTFFDRKIEDGITIIITSAGRSEYLKRTIESLKANLFDVKDEIRWLIIDDNPLSIETREYILSQNFDLVLFNNKNRGLGYSLNKVYCQVKTKYIFHCEDDWLFEEKVPIRKMKDVLNKDESIGQVLLNREENYKAKAICVKGENYSLYEKTYSFNPHLTTKKISLNCLPFPLSNTEIKTTNKLRKRGIKTAILGFDEIYYISHIGIEKKVIKY